MADEFAARVLDPARRDVGRSTETSAATTDVAFMTDGLSNLAAPVDVGIQLVMTDRTLFDGDMEPAVLTGYGAIPAPLARHLARGADSRTRAWVRRLYTDPETGDLTGGDTRRRLFTTTARDFLIARDQVCRTPWCDAPVRHADHVQPYARGGPTHPENGAGLCVGCNQNKESPGWTAVAEIDGRIITITPTGHRYDSSPPPPPRSDSWV